MTDEELKDALDGLHAYDSGCRDSGIHDPVLREKVRAEVLADAQAMGDSAVFGARVARVARELYLSDQAIEQGYGLEDVRGFAEWLAEWLEDDLLGKSG